MLYRASSVFSSSFTATRMLPESPNSYRFAPSATISQETPASVLKNVSTNSTNINL